MNTLPDELILDWWASAPFGSDYALIAQLSTDRGYPLTVHKARRRVKRMPWVRAHLPADRAPRTIDYERAKMIWKSRRDGEALV